MQRVIKVDGIKTVVSGNPDWVRHKCPQLVQFHINQREALIGSYNNGRKKRDANKGYIPIDPEVMRTLNLKRIGLRLGFRELHRRTGISHTQLRHLLQGKQPTIHPESYKLLLKHLNP